MHRLALGALVPLLAACAVQVGGTARAEPPHVIDGARLEREVAATLTADPQLAGAAVQCPHDAVAVPRVTLFCQVVRPTRVSSIPVTILDREGDYTIGRPF